MSMLWTVSVELTPDTIRFTFCRNDRSFTVGIDDEDEDDDDDEEEEDDVDGLEADEEDGEPADFEDDDDEPVNVSRAG